LVQAGRGQREGDARFVLLLALRRGTVQRVKERGERRGGNHRKGGRKGDRLNAEQRGSMRSPTALEMTLEKRRRRDEGGREKEEEEREGGRRGWEEKQSRERRLP
jgi:hypothetical protein